MSKLTSLSLAFAVIFLALISLAGCPGSLAHTPPATNVITNSEVAEAIASGVVTTTWSSGAEARYVPKTPKEKALEQIVEDFYSLIPKAEAASSAGLCVSLQSGYNGVFAPNSTCGYGTNPVSGLYFETLTWAPCNGAAPLGTWSGGVTLALTASALPVPGTPMVCNGFPAFQSGDVLWRNFFVPSARINNFTLNPADGVTPYNPVTGIDLVPPWSSGPVTVMVDTWGASQIPAGSAPYPLPATVPPPQFRSGWYFAVPDVGELITYGAAGATSIIVYGVHLKGSVAGYVTWDFTVSSNISGNPTATLNFDGVNTLTGNLYVQDNIKQNVTKTTFNAVTYTGGATGCGVPTGGNVVTHTIVGSYTDPEQINFSGSCGVATINGTQTFLFHSF